MKIMLLGDCHFRYKSPVRRKDQFFVTLMNKLDQVTNLFFEHGCSAILQVGDFFDSPNQANIVLAAIIERLNRLPPDSFWMVLGQHDVSMHNMESALRSAVNVLVAADVVHLLTSPELGSPTVIGGPMDSHKPCVYGCNWGTDISKPVNLPKGCHKKILVVHQMIGDEKLWATQDLKDPRTFSMEHPEYDLIVCGDYHYTFEKKVGKSLIVNPGALVRLTCSDRNLEHKPCVMIYDTIECSIERIYLEVQDIEDVFDLEKEEGDTKRKESVLAFLDKMRASMNTSISFRDNLEAYCTERGVPDDVKIEIRNALATVKESV